MAWFRLFIDDVDDDDDNDDSEQQYIRCGYRCRAGDSEHRLSPLGQLSQYDLCHKLNTVKFQLQHDVTAGSVNYWYSTFTGERQSQPFCEERGTADSRCGIVNVALTRSTLHTVIYLTWSGVFNKLKFDHLLKKRKNLCF